MLFKLSALNFKTEYPSQHKSIFINTCKSHIDDQNAVCSRNILTNWMHTKLIGNTLQCNQTLCLLLVLLKMREGKSTNGDFFRGPIQKQFSDEHTRTNEHTCTEPCRSAGVRLPSVAPDFWTSGHAATPPLAFVFFFVCGIDEFYWFDVQAIFDFFRNVC